MSDDRDKYVTEVLSGFDFDKLHKAMTVVEWKWRQPDESMAIPTRDQLVSCARDLLEKAWDGKCCVRTGGFGAYYEEAEVDDDPSGYPADRPCLGIYFRFEVSEVDVWT